MYIQLLYQTLLFEESKGSQSSKGKGAGAPTPRRPGEPGVPANGAKADAKTPQSSSLVRAAQTSSTKADLSALSKTQLCLEQPDSLSPEELQKQQKLKARTLTLLNTFIRKKEQLLSRLDLPSYEVSWLKLPATTPAASDKERRESSSLARRKMMSMQVCPQVSYFQAPLLEYAPFVAEQAQLRMERRQNAKDAFAKELNLKGSGQSSGAQIYPLKEVYEIMKPLINAYLLPPVAQPKQQLYPLQQKEVA